MSRFFIALLFVLFVTFPVYDLKSADKKRLDEIAERGSHVMPFDFDKTIHIFTKTNEGGLQQVIAKDKSDSEQIHLIRKHLLDISTEFSQGDFSKPAQIHGDDMPGLAVLQSVKADQISIEYKELSDGAQISYFSQSPPFIEAIHQWFDAQLSDHARHAMPGHPHKHQH
jgi:hypothetical protein